MSFVLSIHSTKAFKEFLLPAVNNTDHSIILSNDIFMLDKDVELVMEVIDNRWHFLPSVNYRIEDTVTKEIASCIDSGDIVKLLDLVKEQEQNGRTLQGICSSLYEHYKDICFKDMSNMTAQRYMRILAELSEKLKRDNSRINFEINMIKMCKPQMETDYSSLVQRIQQLESLVSSLVSGKTVEVQPEPIDNSQFVTIQYKMSPVVTLEYI